MNAEAFNTKVKRNVAHNFDQSIRLYREFEDKHGFFEALTMKMAEAIGIEEHASVLDIGCGYGVSACALHERLGCRVLGVDLSPEMIAAGRSYCQGEGIELCVGDGENLSSLVEDHSFDYALYNASIFIFPDVSRTIAESHRHLRDGGKIAFSFYPQLLGEDDADLFELAFERLGEPLPRFRVITGYAKAAAALESRCVDIGHHRWVRPLDIEFLQDFFSIPAQSASLFPGRGYEERRELSLRLFGTLGDQTKTGRIVWRMAEGAKSGAALRQ
ncbi:class I SAM-dependent methyltransferase [uncultured Desulfosarcina sp.]|uniref:class I SAM-dependent methyltransferase n=1 Tax=uncultured Desulfosarcina sp. TaxID=218289 RepID=UPI0029C72D04|nr:class I SAM-dependent methyltransferase [uncultured Desulfosarcina sp.]